MSRPDDGHRSFFPVGNPFRVILPGGPHLPRKLQALLTLYESTLALSLRELKPEAPLDVLTLSWMRLAVDCLSKLHANIGTLITELELPVSDWDEKWVDIYLNSSVKLLDICIALSTELARLDQGQLLVQYVLHVLDNGGSVPSSEQLKRAEVSLKEWMDKVGARCPRLESCSTTLQELAGSLSLMNVKNSAKGKVLMRALYGIEAVTVFICSVFVAALSGSPQPLVELRIPEKFGWSQAFNDLYTAIGGELRRQLSSGSVAAVKELEEVEACAKKLHVLTSNAKPEEEAASLACAVSHSKDVVMSDNSEQNRGHGDNLKIADDTSRECEVIMSESSVEEGTQEAESLACAVSHSKDVVMSDNSEQNRGHGGNLKIADDTSWEREVIMSESSVEERPQDAEMKQDTKTINCGNEVTMLESIRQVNNTNQTNGISDKKIAVIPEGTSVPVGREELLNCISRMLKCAEGLRLGLDSLSKRVGDFFQIVLTGRDALLCNLRMSGITSKVAVVRS